MVVSPASGQRVKFSTPTPLPPQGESPEYLLSVGALACGGGEPAQQAAELRENEGGSGLQWLGAKPLEVRTFNSFILSVSRVSAGPLGHVCAYQLWKNFLSSCLSPLLSATSPCMGSI